MTTDIIQMLGLMDRAIVADLLHRAGRCSVAILVGIAAFFLNLQPIRAADSPNPAFVKPNDVRSGSLLLKTGDDNYADATRLGIDVDITVSGPTARARITQVFRNSTQNWVEATYV